MLADKDIYHDKIYGKGHTDKQTNRQTDQHHDSDRPKGRAEWKVENPICNWKLKFSGRGDQGFLLKKLDFVLNVLLSFLLECSGSGDTFSFDDHHPPYHRHCKL